jgi:hypothetical protein
MSIMKKALWILILILGLSFFAHHYLPQKRNKKSLFEKMNLIRHLLKLKVSIKVQIQQSLPFSTSV